MIRSAIYWRNLVWRQLRFACRHPERTIFFRFEDLTEKPVELAQALFETLELPPVPKPELRKRINLNYRESVNAEEKGKGISTTPNERWKEKLAPQSIELVNELCGPVARDFGYQLPAPK